MITRLNLSRIITLNKDYIVEDDLLYLNSLNKDKSNGVLFVENSDENLELLKYYEFIEDKKKRNLIN